MHRRPEVLWLFSPIRSGSSITVYAAAAGLGCAVADEIFGPWDRTGPPYNYPPRQRALRDAFEGAGQRLSPEAVEIAGDVLSMIAGPAPVVICKHPHSSIGPEDVSARWRDHRAAVLMRNPLWALNSLFVRGWDEATGGGSMLRYFSTIGRRWLESTRRLVYEDLKRDPRAYFEGVYRAWGIEPTPAMIDGAVEYRDAHYHQSSGETHRASDPTRVRSEQSWGVPESIVAEYLADPLMRRLFEEARWPRERDAYPDPAGAS